MKRQKRKSGGPNNLTRNKAQNQSTENVVAEPGTTRRRFLRRAGNGALATLVVGGGGWYMIEDVKATMREHDLSQIGNGTPAIVQIHDPQCPRCVTLQHEARDALCNLESGDQLQFLVANVMSAEGRQLAAANGVGNVTLLLFDADGRRRNVIAGSYDSEYLTEAFRLHASLYGKR